MKLFFMGGTFDPVHLGHLEMARQAALAYNPDQLLFIPGRQNPLKTGQPGASGEQRLEMLRLALQDSDFTIDSWELEQAGPSYTWQTVQYLKQQYGAGITLSMIIGDDLLGQLPEWCRWEELERELEFIILPRVQTEHDRLPLNCRLLDVSRVAVSATQVRDTIAAGGELQELLPPVVIDYIRREQLYGQSFEER